MIQREEILSKTTTVIVRRAQPGDVPTVYCMLRESAVEQDGVQDLCADPGNLLEDGFLVAPPRFQCLLAEIAGYPAGIVLYYWTYSTWTSRGGVYIEDLYVSPGFRRRGIARCLMVELAKVAIGAGCPHIRWLVLRENSAAVGFYESIGAELSQGWSSMHIEGKRLERFVTSQRGSVWTLKREVEL